MKSTICLLTVWTLKAGGHLKADSMYLIKKGARAVLLVVEGIALQMERKFDMLQKALLRPLCTCGG